MSGLVNKGLSPAPPCCWSWSPVFRRRDAPAEIWQYQGPTCVLDLFLYREGDSGPLTVDHFETRAKGNDVLTDAECLVSIMKTVERAKAG